MRTEAEVRRALELMEVGEVTSRDDALLQTMGVELCKWMLQDESSLFGESLRLMEVRQSQIDRAKRQ